MPYKNIEDKRRHEKEYRSKSYVKEKRSIAWKSYYQKNKEAIREKAKIYHNENREAINRKSRKYQSREDVKIRKRIYLREYAKKNRDKESAKTKRWRLKHKEKWNAYVREHIRRKRKTNINFLIMERLRSRLKDIFRHSRSGMAIKFLGCSLVDFKKYLESKFEKGMSWSNKGEWHIDHIIPCNSFDLTKEEEAEKCFHYTNLQPLWALDNLRKGSKILINTK
jgi:hypothetical protein